MTFMKAKKKKEVVTVKEEVKKEPTIKRVKKDFSDIPEIKDEVFKSHKIVEHKSIIIDHLTDIDHIQFTFLSNEEILKNSVCEITETRFEGSNSLYDPLMGPTNNKEVCYTCESGWEDCPGHFGHIRLAVKLPHPLLYKKILEYLKIFCKKCYRLVIDDDKIKFIGANKGSNESKYNKIYNEIANNINCCMHCGDTILNYIYRDDKYLVESNDKALPLMYNEICDRFDNITSIDLQKLGIDPNKIHPSNYIIQNLIVVPPCVRPPVQIEGDGAESHDDLTYKYIEILKINKKLVECNSEKTKYDYTNVLMFHVKTLMNNNKDKARVQDGKRAIKCIKKRISGKQGLIRKHIQGKRTDFSARTVIGPEANCMVDEVIVPELIAKDITIPVTVNKINLKKCQDLLDRGKVNFIIRDGNQISTKYALWTAGTEIQFNDQILRYDNKKGDYDQFDPYKYELLKGEFKLLETDKIVRNKEIINVKLPKRKPYELREGDVIERQLQNGDWVLFNRQPTLWKGSMRAKKVVIRPGKTFRFSLASTAAFNADFDKQSLSKTGGLKRL